MHDDGCIIAGVLVTIVLGLTGTYLLGRSDARDDAVRCHRALVAAKTGADSLTVAIGSGHCAWFLERLYAEHPR